MELMKYSQNYHSHKDDTNIMVTDSPVQYEAYAKRCVELGSKVLSSVAHGWQGRYHYAYEVAKKYGLKFIFGTEAYWVKNRFENDSSNCHIIILAKNENGRQDINETLSIANEDGFHRQPRIDLDLIMTKLTPSDVFITSACIGGWKYEDAEDIWLQIHKRFGDNFMLEVQYHNTPEQKLLNEKIVRMAKENNIQLIMGMDSHYIDESQSIDRDDLLASKCIKYEEESGWYMDFPSNEVAYQRFVEQGILTHDEIVQAINNTNIILDFEDIEFDRSLKLPTIFPDKTQKEKDVMYKNIILKEWDLYSKSVPLALHQKYKREIIKEMKVVINTGMSDYFLLNYHLIKNAVKRGGIITKTGRGSASSFFTNTLLRFSNLDRVVSPVTLYPDRFMSETRILKNNSSPDIDFNTYHTDIFIEEQTKLLGEGHSYPMIAFGKLKPKSAFKMYARSQGMNPDLANDISKEIAKFEKAYNNADDDTKEEMSIYDYIDEQYHSYIQASESYLGILADKKISPCSHILYKGDIRREIGIMRLMNKTSKKVVMCACIEGHVADRFGYMKNDLLSVSVWGIIENIYKRIGITSHSINELSAIIENDPKTWDIYARGLTICINQCESAGTTSKVMKYRPTNISELTAFIAGIRPSFKSMYNIFESRKPFAYGIKAFDDLIQTEEMPYSFVLYQEQMMNTLNYAGFDISECYDIIKAIAKKHPEKVAPLKQQFIKGFGDKIKETEPLLTEEAIEENCLKVWKIIEDSAGYGFNSSHALAYAYDSIYCAYLKANYPYEFYTEILQTYSDKGEKDRVVKIIQEMEKGFGIKLGAYKFGLDNREFVMDKENGVIYPSLQALKNFNEQAPIDLYNIKDKKFGSFTELLIELVHNTSLDKTKINILIKLGYFSDFGKNKKLYTVYEQFQKRYKKTHVEKTRMARKLEMIEFENSLKDETFGIKEQLKNEIEVLGYPITKLEKAPEDAYMVTEIDDKYSTRTVTLYRIQTGEFITCKIYKDDFQICPFALASIMRVPAFNESKFGNYYLKQYTIIG